MQIYIEEIILDHSFSHIPYQRDTHSFENDMPSSTEEFALVPWLCMSETLPGS